MSYPLPIRLLLMDDHALIRSSLSMLFKSVPEIELVAETGTLEDAVQMIEEHDPDVALVDLILDEGSGLDLVKYINDNDLRTKVMLISSITSPILISHALSLPGVYGFVSKYDSPEELVAGLHKAADEKSFIGESLKDVVETSVSTKLTVREFQVMSLVADGLEDKEISARLGISTETVKTHRRNLRNKLNVRNSAELTKYALTGKK